MSKHYIPTSLAQTQNTSPAAVTGNAETRLPQPNDMKAVALWYAARGMSVFPAHSVVNGRCTCGSLHEDDPKQIGKHPATINGYKDASTDPLKIEKWFGHELRNVAIATGEISNVLVYDIDGPLGEENHRQFEAKFSTLSATLTDTTGRGKQMFFKYPKGMKIDSFSRHDLGLDGRANKGYVIAPPSCHANGKIYQWLDPAAEIAEAPQALIELFLTKGNSFKPKDKAKTDNSFPPFNAGSLGPTHGVPTLNIGTFTAPPVWTEAEERKLLSALSYIKPIGNEVWFDVCCVLKWLSKFWGEEKCWLILDAWSRREPDHYSYENNLKRWNSLSANHPDPKTVGTIYEMAKARGWTPDIIEAFTPTLPVSPVVNGQWPQALPFATQSVAATYPVDALPLTIREAVQEVQRFVKAPVAMIATSALSALSLATQALVDVKRDEKLVGPVGLYYLTVASSGERKTTCDNIFLNAIRDYEAQKEAEAQPLNMQYQAMLKAWEAKHNGIANAIKDATKKGRDTKDLERRLIDIEKEKPQPPKVQRLVYNDATPEALIHKLAKTYPAGGVISSEAGIVFGGHGMSKETIMRNLATFNSLWDGLTYRSDRQSVESCTLRGARLTVALQVQKTVILEFFDRAKDLPRGSGFLARFMMSEPVSTQGTRFYDAAPEHWPKLSTFHHLIRGLLNKPLPLSPEGVLQPYAISMMPGAKAAWIKFHDNVERELRVGGKYFDVQDVASKIADNAARLAAQFQVFEHGISPVDEPAMKSACRIAAWHLGEAQRFFHEIALPQQLANAERLDRWLIEVCKAEGINTVPCRRVSQYGPRSVREKEKMNTALRELTELGRLRVILNGTANIIHVNPALLGVA